MKKELIISSSILILLFLILLLVEYDYEKKNVLKVSDHFTEINHKGLFTFVFVESKEFDEVRIKEFSRQIFREHKSFENDSIKTKILVAYYFNRQDSTKVPPAYLSKLKMKYPNVNNLSQKINYYPNGYVYTTYKSRAKVKNIAKDSLFKTPVFAPKKEFKSKNLLKNMVVN